MEQNPKYFVLVMTYIMFVAVLSSVGSTTNTGPEENLPLSAYNIPAQEYEIIIRKPLISVPVIQERGETIELWVKNPVADEETSWHASLFKAYGSYEEEYEMDVIYVEEGDENEWFLTCVIPVDAREELYDLRLNDGTESTERIQSVKVVHEITDQFNFVQVTDAHFGATHDEGSETYIRRFFNEMNLIRPDFIILTGDVCDKEPTWWSPQDPHPSEQDEGFYELLQELEVPMYVVHGNHDYSYTSDDDPDYNIRSYQKWINPHLNYTFTYAEDYHFIMQNSGKYVGTLNPDGLMTMDNVTWMINELQDNMDKTMRFVGMHHTVYPDTIDDNSVRDAFRQAARDYNVTSVFAGHIHTNRNIYDAYGTEVTGDPTLGLQPLHVSTGDLVKSVREYRLVRINGEEIETLTYDTNGDGERDSKAGMPLGGITVDYSPANDGTNTEVIATIENDLYEYFNDAFVNFNVAPPEHGYEYIVENATVFERIDKGDMITFYARTDIDVSSTKFVTIRQELIPGEPPSINITSPIGGEMWYAGTDNEITWTTSPGDDPIDHIELFYSVDAGYTWTTITTGHDDTGSFTWTVPNEHSGECLVGAGVYDVMGRLGEDHTGIFEIIGIPPEPPTNLAVEHYGTGMLTLFSDDVEGGDLGYTTGTSESPASEWGIRSHGATSGVNSWDFGDGQYYKTSAYGYLSWLISPGIEIPAGAENVELRFDHWRSFGMQTTYLDGGNLKISTNGVDYTLITPNEGYDGVINDAYGNPLGGQQAWGGTVGWETVTFDLSAYTGETIHLRWDAGIEAYDEDIEEGWRIDDILLTALVVGEGDEHNLLSWHASPHDPSDVARYNIYRSEEYDGIYEYVDSVAADGSASYEYIDLDKGTADEIFWWYIVRAEGENGLEEQNTYAKQEPGAPLETFEIPLYAGGAADGWNFVSFNLIPADMSLEAILGSIDGNYNKVMYFDASLGEWSSYVPGRTERYNNLGMWTHRMGIWIHMNIDDTLTIMGTSPTNTDITLYPGWTMVGLPGETAGNHGLPGVVDVIGYFDSSQTYNLAYDYSPETFLFEPGQGYWIHNPTDATVVWTVYY